MADSFGTMHLARGPATACLTLVTVATAAAQQPQVIAEAPPRPEFLSRYDFNMSAAKLAYPDPRFSWDVHWGGDFDLFDYVYGRDHVHRRLSGPARQRIPPVRSVPEQLHARGDRLRAGRQDRGRSASSVTCRGTWAIGSSRWRSRKIRSGPRVMRRFVRRRPSPRGARERAQGDRARLRRLHLDGRHRSVRRDRPPAEGRVSTDGCTVRSSRSTGRSQGAAVSRAGVSRPACCCAAYRRDMELFVGVETRHRRRPVRPPGSALGLRWLSSAAELTILR